MPTSSVSNARRLALDGVVRNVAAPVANPLTPVDIGSPVPFVSVTLVGVPRAPFTVANVPVVGNVTVVVPVIVKVDANAPDVVKLPPKATALPSGPENDSVLFIVAVLPAPSVRVPVPAVHVFPLNVEPVMVSPA